MPDGVHSVPRQNVFRYGAESILSQDRRRQYVLITLLILNLYLFEIEVTFFSASVSNLDERKSRD